MTDKHVLVTGAAGFIGNACAGAIGSRLPGDRAVHHNNPQGLEGVPVVRASITDRPGLLAALADDGPFDAVVNCAGRATDVGRQWRFRQANYEGVMNLIECVRAGTVGRLVQISTTDVYGIRDFHDADEQTPLHDNLRNPYPRYKIMAEQAIVERLEARQYVILRPGAVWGPGDRTIIPRMLDYLRSTPAIFHFGRWHGHNRWPLAHVTNVARAAWLATSCDDALGQAYNVTDTERTTIDEYYRILLAVFLPRRVGMKSATLPFALGRLTGRISSLLSNILDLHHPLYDPSHYALYCLSRDMNFSNRKLVDWFSRHGLTLVTRDEEIQTLPRPI